MDEVVFLDLLVTNVGLSGGTNSRQVLKAVQRCPGRPVLFINGWPGDALPPGVEVMGKFSIVDMQIRCAADCLEQR